MTRSTIMILRIALAAAAGVGCLVIGDRASLTKPESLLTKAEARVGRPLTPVSYAGVARRTTRRAVAAGAAVGAAAVVVAPRPGCVQVVDAYGQISYRCP